MEGNKMTLNDRQRKELVKIIDQMRKIGIEGESEMIWYLGKLSDDYRKENEHKKEDLKSAKEELGNMLKERDLLIDAREKYLKQRDELRKENELLKEMHREGKSLHVKQGRKGVAEEIPTGALQDIRPDVRIDGSNNTIGTIEINYRKEIDYGKSI